MLRNYIDLPRPVHILCLGTFINRAGALVIPFIALYVKNQLGYGDAFATQAIGAYGVGALAAAQVGGHFADRIGRRPVILFALVGGAGMMLLVSTLHSKWAILSGMAMLACVAEMYRPATSAMISDLVEPAKRPYAFGLMYLAINLGFSIGPVVAGELIRRSYRLLFWGDALTMLAYAAIILFAIRETLPRRTESAARVSTKRDIGESFANMLGNRPFLVFCLSGLLTGCVFHQAMSTLPLHLEKLGLDAYYGRLIAINGIMIVALQVPLTVIFTRFHRVGVMAAGAFMTGLGFGATIWATGVWWLALTVVIWTLGEMMQAPFTSSIIGDLAPTQFRARYFGTYTMMFSGAMMIGPILGGLLMDRHGSSGLWAACFLVCLVSGGLLLTIVRRIGPAGGQAEIVTKGEEVLDESVLEHL